MMRRRGSGILLHVSSLPSRHGIGDLGPGARRFIQFMVDTGQSYWQILPLNPTSVQNGNSPYSTDSAFAGNPLFISLEDLVEEGLLDRADVKPDPGFSARRVNYPLVTQYKARALNAAYQRLRGSLTRERGFERFAESHRAWLDDFALFHALKAHFRTPSWTDWPKEARDRDPGALRRYGEQFVDRIERERVFQYWFFRQWLALKEQCRHQGIRLIGDIPIYLHGDACDVWRHPEVFKLGPDKRPTHVAGVPPDLFSADGQLWEVPVYRWTFLKGTKYKWWIDRLRHVLRLVDQARLDHFRGFCDYWEVPAHHRTARHGKWVKGPRADFFHAVKKAFPSLPFIAEDLGEITPEVDDLRDRFKIPGMRVLQYAFGNDPLAVLYMPHNYIPNSVAYTGTHDNDTLMGWIAGTDDHSTRSSAEIREERAHALAYLGPRRHSRASTLTTWASLGFHRTGNGVQGRHGDRTDAGSPRPWARRPDESTRDIFRKLGMALGAEAAHQGHCPKAPHHNGVFSKAREEPLIWMRVSTRGSDLGARPGNLAFE